MSKETQKEDIIPSIDKGLAKKLSDDLLFFGVCIYRTHEDGTQEYINPMSEEALKATELPTKQ
jgi:hypothetical protein